MNQGERESELRNALVSLTAAVMSLARDLNSVMQFGLSPETIEKCNDATSAIHKALRDVPGA